MISFETAVKEFIKDFEQRCIVRSGYVSGTSKVYRNILKRFKNYLGLPTPSVESITEKEISGFLSELRSLAKSSGSYAVNAFSCLRSFFKFTQKRYGIPDPTRTIERPKVYSKESNYFTPKEVEKILGYLGELYMGNKIDNRNSVIFELWIRTGPRISEIRHLDLDDIQITDGTITITYLGKGNKERKITTPITPKVIGFKNRLEHYITQVRKNWKVKSPNEKAFFLSVLGTRLSQSQIRCSFTNCMKKLGFSGYTPHSLRHSYITNALDAGVDVASVCKIVGHGNPAITHAVYNHSNREKMKQAMVKAFFPIQSDKEVAKSASPAGDDPPKLRLTTSTLQKWIERKNVKTKIITGKRFIPQSDLERAFNISVE